MSKAKPKLGIYSFSCCEGCQVMFFQLERDLLSVFELVDLTTSRLLGVEGKPPRLDVAVVEGSIMGSKAISKLRKVRKSSDYLIALGACATTGGIPAIRNSLPEATKKRLQSLSPKPEGVHKVSDIVQVDYHMHGCPVSEHELLKVLLKLGNGVVPKEPLAPVCSECKMRETYCLLINGEPCLGPAALAGCDAPCPAEGFYCNACRGLYSDANLESLRKVLRSQGLTKARIDKMLQIYNSPTPEFQTKPKGGKKR